jgi:putative SOS response-associated peptidase YedK
MCGRYIIQQAAKAERYWELYGTKWTTSFNIAPSQQVPVVRSAHGVREGTLMRWGLIPFFARGEPPKYSTINAAIEKLETGMAWRGPWTRGQRCILPASGFYEWHVNHDGSKQPFLIQLADREDFGFAGLWDRSFKSDGSTIESCTMITMDATPLMAEIHNAKQRMPAILAAQDHEAWLSGNQLHARAALRQYPDDLLVAYKVSSRVNSPKNNDEQLVAQLPVESEQEPRTQAKATAP